MDSLEVAEDVIDQFDDKISGQEALESSLIEASPALSLECTKL